MLKYIAVHTLNGELYNQEKLFNCFKFRFYSIKEINYALLTIFFEANTIITQHHRQQHHHNHKESIRSSNSSLNQFNNMQLTVLNCFSIIIPLEFQQYLLDKSEFIMNAFENSILEFRVLAEVMEKVNNVTLAIQHLSKCVEELCDSLKVLENKGINDLNVNKSLIKILNHILIYFFKFIF